MFEEIARKIWFRCNTWIHEGTFLHLDAIMREAACAIQEFQQATQPEGRTPLVRVERQL